MPTLANCIGKSELLKPYRRRLLDAQKRHSLEVGMEEGALRAIDEVQQAAKAELDQMLGQLGLGRQGPREEVGQSISGAPVQRTEVRASLPEQVQPAPAQAAPTPAPVFTPPAVSTLPVEEEDPAQQIRFSLGRVTSQAGLKAQLDRPNVAKDTIEMAARQQGWLIPMFYDRIFKHWKSNDPALTAAQKRAGSLLTSMFHQTGLKGTYRPVTPMTTTLTDEARNHGANSILLQDQINRDLVDRLIGAEKVAMNAFIDAQKNDIERLLLEGHAAAFNSEADLLLENFREYLDEQKIAAKNSADKGMAAHLMEAAGSVGAFRQGQLLSLASFLKNAAMQIPDTALKDSASTAAWIRARQADKTQPPLGDDATFLFLTTPWGSKRIAPLETYKSLHLRLAKVKKITAEGKAAAVKVAALKAKLGGKQQLRHFAKTYAQLLKDAEDAFDTASVLSKEFAKAKVNYEGAQLARQTMQDMISHPDYIGVLADAAVRSNARAYGITYEEQTKDHAYTGYSMWVNPLNGEHIKLDLSTDKGAKKDNKDKVLKLIEDVHTWLGSTDATLDPILKNTWSQGGLPILKQWMVNVGDPNFVGTTLPFGFSIPSVAKPFQSVFRLLPGADKYLTTIRNLVHEVGGMSMVRVSRIAASADAFQAYIQARDDLQIDIDEAIEKAMAKRGRKTTGWNQDWYRRIIFEPILSQNQNPRNDPFEVGDKLYDGEEVLKEDLDAARMQTIWLDGMYKFLQAQGFKAQGLEPNDADYIIRALLQEPMMKETEKGYYAPGKLGKEGAVRRKEAQRSLAFGFKAPRVKDKQGDIWANLWHEAALKDKEATALLPAGSKEVMTHRLAALRDPEYFRVTMIGTMVETNDEFRTSYNSENQDTRREIIDHFRAGTLPNDLDGIAILFGQIEADRKVLLGASPAVEAREFLERMVGHIQKWQEKYLPPVDPKEGEKLGQPGAKTDVTVVGPSPFVRERGEMLGPSTYYKFSQADQRSRLQLQEQVMIHFRRALGDALGSAEAAIDRDIQSAYKTPMLAKVVPGKPKSRFLTRSATIKHRRRVAAQKGQVNQTIGQLHQAKRMVQRIREDMDRINAEHAEQTMDDYGLRMMRKLASIPIVGVLVNTGTAINNIMQGMASVSVMAHSMGNGGMFSPLPEAFNTALTVLGLLGRNLNSPVLRTIANMWGGDLTDEEFSNALRQGLGRRWNVIRETNQASKFASTGGVSSAEAEEDPLLGKVFALRGVREVAWFANLVGKGISRTLPGEIENAFNLALLIQTRKMLNRNVSRYVNFIRGEEATGPGWENRLITGPDRTNAFLRKFVKSEKGIATLRHVLQEIGSLEEVLIRFHERTKGMSVKAAQSQPLLTPDELVQVGMGIARDFNKRSFSSELHWFLGKGFGGFIKSLASIFLRAPSQASGAISIYLGETKGEYESQVSRSIRHSKLAAVILLSAVAGMEWKYGVAEWLFNMSRPVRRMDQIEEPSDLVVYLFAALSPFGSFIPALIMQMAGESSVKPLADISQMNLAANVALDLSNAVVTMLQTHNVTQPVNDLVDRYFPLARIISSRTTKAGEPETISASRELRFAAPPGVEVRKLGGGGGGLNRTPLTPVIRKLAQAVARDDKDEVNRLMAQAVQMQVASGYTPEEAMVSVQRSLANRSPVQRAFPSRLSEGEMAMAYARLPSAIRPRVQQLQARFDAATSRKKTGGSATKGRRRRKRRSALRSRRRRSSLGSAASFSYA